MAQRSIGISRAEVKLGLCNVAYNMKRILLFDEADRIKEGFFGEKQMKGRLFQSGRLEKEESKS